MVFKFHSTQVLLIFKFMFAEGLCVLSQLAWFFNSEFSLRLKYTGFVEFNLTPQTDFLSITTFI